MRVLGNAPLYWIMAAAIVVTGLATSPQHQSYVPAAHHFLRPIPGITCHVAVEGAVCYERYEVREDAQVIGARDLSPDGKVSEIHFLLRDTSERPVPQELQAEEPDPEESI
jgi:hypothetical protein